MSRSLVVGNWKMHASQAQVEALLGALKVGMPKRDRVEVAVCPPYPYLMQAAHLLAGSGIALGAQNLSVEASGAYTGEVSGPMLADVGCRYVIVGHPSAAPCMASTTPWWRKNFAPLSVTAWCRSCAWVSTWPSARRMRPRLCWPPRSMRCSSCVAMRRLPAR